MSDPQPTAAEAAEVPAQAEPLKNYVLDTNVLLHDPQALFRFKENAVVIPIVVIEEIDKFKKDLSELGKNARQCSRILDKLRESGSLAEGVALPDGGTLRVDLGLNADEIRGLEVRSNDNVLLRTAVSLSRSDPSRPVVLISKDTNVRIKADAFGLDARDFEESEVSLDELYSGNRELNVSQEQVDALYAQGELVIPNQDFHINEFALLRNADRPNITALSRYNGPRKALLPVRRHREGLYGLQPRNKEQVFAFDLLVDDDIKLVTLVGKAGTGKTLLAIAAGLHKVEEGRYNRLVVSRPIFPLGKDIGFLPGDIEEKLNPWMKPIYDNIEFLQDIRKEGVLNKKGPSRGHLDLVSQGLLQIEPLTYIRGRSIPNQFLIIDEAQNLTPHEIKTIVTRAGEGTKVVLTGDPYQIDNPYIDSSNNGLTYTVERFKDQPIAGHVTLVKGERSDLAELAANLL